MKQIQKKPDDYATSFQYSHSTYKGYSADATETFYFEIQNG